MAEILIAIGLFCGNPGIERLKWQTVEACQKEVLDCVTKIPDEPKAERDKKLAQCFAKKTWDRG